MDTIGGCLVTLTAICLFSKINDEVYTSIQEILSSPFGGGGGGGGKQAELSQGWG